MREIVFDPCRCEDEEIHGCLVDASTGRCLSGIIRTLPELQEGLKRLRTQGYGRGCYLRTIRMMIDLGMPKTLPAGVTPQCKGPHAHQKLDRVIRDRAEELDIEQLCALGRGDGYPPGYEEEEGEQVVPDDDVAQAINECSMLPDTKHRVARNLRFMPSPAD